PSPMDLRSTRIARPLMAEILWETLNDSILRVSCVTNQTPPTETNVNIAISRNQRTSRRRRAASGNSTHSTSESCSFEENFTNWPVIHEKHGLRTVYRVGGLASPAESAARLERPHDNHDHN